MASVNPWITVKHGRSAYTITEWTGAMTHLKLPAACKPTITALIGKRTKSEALRGLLSATQKTTASGHGQAFLLADLAPKAEGPTLYLDYELQTCELPRWHEGCGSGPAKSRTIDLLANGSQAWSRRRVGNMLCGRAIAPLCDTLCYFSADCGGMRVVAALLAEIMSEQAAVDVPQACLPRVIVVVDTMSKQFDPHLTELRLMDELGERLGDKQDVACRLRLHFHSIRILGSSKRVSPRERWCQLRKRICAIKRDVFVARTLNGLDFRRNHLFALSTRLLDHYGSKRSEPFSFVRATRPSGSTVEDLPVHLEELITLLPVEVWLWHLIVPLLSSSIIMASYPPGSHNLSVEMVFDECYLEQCRKAINSTVVQSALRDSFLVAIRKRLYEDFQQLRLESAESRNVYHVSRLRELHPYLGEIKTHKTCLACLLRPPEKVLTCGHALCDVCVQYFGQTSSEERNAYFFQACVLCGASNERSPFFVLPPTAGARVLSLDGGGVRGIIPVILLQQLECRLSGFGLPVRDFFDFVCGTSAGGLIAIGLFVMRWTIAESLTKFEDLARKTFQRQTDGTHYFARLQQFIVSYLRDCQYSSSAIEHSFQTTFGKDIGLFNPLTTDTKVAITTTSAKETAACIFSNYNGAKRPKTLGYDLIRADKSEDDVVVSEAACCTSAAPWFFRPRSLQNLGTFQDGGLQYNNPLNIALWETRFVWPHKSVDFALSLGTGVTALESATFKAGPHSPVKDRFLPRLFRTFMKSMDGERIWREIHNSLPEKERPKYHRLNVPLSGTEPLLDDISAIENLKEQSVSWAQRRDTFTSLLDSVYASMFYFELDQYYLREDGTYACTGSVHCRLALDVDGRQHLYDLLQSTSSYFLTLGQPTPCVTHIPRNLPPYKRAIDIVVNSLDDDIGITLLGITSIPTTISGLPRTVRDLIHVQQLDTPFGRAGCSTIEKMLPRVPG